MITWPPSVGHVRSELRRAPTDLDSDDLLATALDAALAFVVRVKGGQYNVTGDPLSLLPSPGPDLAWGAVRLAVRLHTRRRSPDGLIDLGELGSARVPSFDPDIDRLLGIGRFAPPVIA